MPESHQEKYSGPNWTGIDGGREGLWDKYKWLEVLRVISKHQGEDVYDENAAIYEELEEKFPADKWRSHEDSGRFRPLFRDYPHAWVRTKMLDISDHRFRLTPQGQRVVNNQSDPSLALVTALSEHEENSDKPFSIFASAFLALPEHRFTLEELYWGVQKNFRPGVDELDDALSITSSVTDAITSNTQRRMKAMLKLLEQVNAIAASDNEWIAYDKDILRSLVDDEAASEIVLPSAEAEALGRMIDEFHAKVSEAGFIYERSFIENFICSLVAKRFLILTGLSGSGKTLLARLFAHWISESSEQFVLLAVGANWTSNRNIVGYPDAFDSTKFHKTAALSLLLRAQNHPEVPHFLVLDEMNLSHVERYFSDFLSAIESKEEKFLIHNQSVDIDGVPPYIRGLPENLFIIGTVNIDETTYMFSPKVLDRANVLEFRISKSSFDNFLSVGGGSEVKSLDSLGSAFSTPFVSLNSSSPDFSALPDDLYRILKSELLALFSILAEENYEFGFRTSTEFFRFSYYYYEAVKNGLSDHAIVPKIVDAQILQKVLPRIHGPRKKVEPILIKLLAFCFIVHEWESATLSNFDEISSQGQALLGDISNVEKMLSGASGAFLPASSQKVGSMIQRLWSEGFVAFAEA